MVKPWSRSWHSLTPVITGSHHMSLKDHTFGRKFQNARMNQAIDHGCNWNDGDVLYSELETVLHREASSAVAMYCFGPQKTQFISSLYERTVIYITQLGCPPIADIILPGINCTFAWHNTFRHACALRTAYSLAQWLNFCTLSLQYAKCPSQPAYN